MTREEYLNNAITEFRADFDRVGNPLPEKIRVACGWPSRSGLSRKNRRIGECWSSTCSDDQSFEIFISPVLKHADIVLATLAHELVHAAVGTDCGHRGQFKKCMVALGLEGKATATHAGDKLVARIHDVVSKIGDYPHAELKCGDQNKKKQTCRQLKLTCTDCGCICRMSRQAIDDVGCPTCACGGQMQEEETSDED